jgi:hypothetical protein
VPAACHHGSEQLGDARVEHLAVAAQEQVVGRLLQKRVAELVAGAWPADRSQHSLADELGESSFESCRIQRFECLEQLPRELASEHGGHVDHLAEPGEPVEPLGQQAVEARRHDRRVRVAFGGVGPDRTWAAVDVEHPHHLLDEQRNAVGGGDHPLENGGVECGSAAHPQHRPHVLRREPPELDLEDGFSAPPGRLEVAAEGEDAQDRNVRHARDDPAEQVDGRRVCPVEVLDDEEQGMASWVGNEQRLEGTQQQGTSVAWHQRRAGSLVARRERQQAGQQWHRLDRIDAGVTDGSVEHLERAFGGIRPFEEEISLEEPDHRVQRAALVVRGALPHLHRTNPVPELFEEGADETALANARLSRHVGDGAVAGCDPAPGVAEPGQVRVPTNQRRKAPGTKGLEAAHRAAR